MPTQAYRLRIRNAADTANALTITSVRSGTNPYIASIPSGDGQEVDLLTGAVRTGAYVVEVVDAVTGSTPTGTLRVVTSQLYDSIEEYLLLEDGDKILLESGDPIELELSNAEFGRVHLLSRRAFLEVSTDGGATWPTVWQAGFLSNVTQIDAIRYAFTISNTRRVEQTQRIFTWSTEAERLRFPQRGCIVGGPVIGGFGVRPSGLPIARDSGGWEFKFLGSVNAQFAIFFKSGYYLSLEFIRGSVPPNYERKTTFSIEETDILYAGLNPFVQYDAGVSFFDTNFQDPIWDGLRNRNKVAAYPNLVAIITDDNGNEWRGSIPSFFSQPEIGSWYIPGLTVYDGGNRLFVRLLDEFTDKFGNPLTALPAVNSTFRVRIVSKETTEQSPLYFDLHPVDVVTKLYEIANIEYKSQPDSNAADYVGSAQWMKQRLGATLRIAARITEPQVMAEFLEKAIFGPFGFACRTGPTGQQEFFVTRELGGTIDYTITDADIQGDAPPAIWSLDEGTAVTGFLIKQRQLTQYIQPQNTTELGPPDNLVETAQPIQYLNGDTTTFSTRIVEYDIPGMVHDASSFTPTIEPLGLSISLEGFERFGRGAPASEVPVLGTSAAAAAQVGDLVYLNAGYYPNKNYRIGESNVGARVAQIVRRDERPEGPIFKLVDAGLANQPALAPAITIAASTKDARRVAQFTITNGAALSNTDEILVAVEWATGPTQPALAGQTFQRYAAGAIPTVPVLLPPVVPGTTVWVRARTEQDGLFPSAWTNWTSITLSAWNSPASLTISELTSNRAVLSWDNGGNTTDNIDVYLYPGSVAPSDWTPYRLTTLSSGSTSTVLTGLTGSTNYIVALAYVDILSDARGTVETRSFTTNTTVLATAPRPAGFAVIPTNEEDGIWATGVQLALWSALNAEVIVIERAPDNAGLPGAYVVLGTVTADTKVFVDFLPQNGTVYWYRIKHQQTGKPDSPYMPEFEVGGTTYYGIKASAAGVARVVLQPEPNAPVITPFTIADNQFTPVMNIGVNYDDPQNRISYYEYRTRTRTGTSWGAWSAYTKYEKGGYSVIRTGSFSVIENQPTSSTVRQMEWRVYGSDTFGTIGYIAQGTSEWPQNYGTNEASINVLRSYYDTATGKYTVFWRYYFQLGNGQLDEDGSLNKYQTFTTGVVAASVKDSQGNVATNVVNVAKTSNGWSATWDSTIQQSWNFEIAVTPSTLATYQLQYQNSNTLTQEFIAVPTSQAFVGPAASPTGEWSGAIFGLPTNGADVSSQLTTIVNAINAAGGGALYLPPGTYDLSSDLELPRLVTLRGDNPETTVITSTNSTTRYVKLKGQADRFHNISGITFDKVGIIYGETKDDQASGVALTNCQIKNVIGNAVTYRFNSYLTQINNCRIFNNVTGVYLDFSTDGTGTVSVSGTTATFSSSQSGLIGQRFIASGQIFTVTAGSGTSWTVTPAASPAVSGASFRYGVIFNAGAAMKISNTDIFCDDAFNALYTTNGIVMQGYTQDGYQLWVTDCDLEHFNASALKTLQVGGDGGIFVSNANLELMGNLSAPGTAGYWIDNSGAKIWLDGYVGLSTTELAWFRNTAGIIYVQKGRGSFNAAQFCVITGGAIIVDQSQMFGAGRPFNYPSNALAYAPNSASTGGMIMTTRNKLALTQNVTVPQLTVGAPTQSVLSVQPFDSNNRVITFDLESDVAGATDNILRIDMANGVTGPPRIDMILPLVAGYGKFTIYHAPRRQTSWDNATLVNGYLTITGVYIETATGISTYVNQTVADDGPPYTTKTLTFSTIAVTGGAPVASVIDIYNLTEDAFGPALTGI